MALLFFPRGGSAQVARYMARALPRAGWDVRLLSGSLGAPGDATNADTFFSGIDVRAVDYRRARGAAGRAFPSLPVVGHLHGTEVLMLNQIAAGPPAGWDHAAEWAERMRGWAQRCERLLVLSPDAAERAPGLLGVDPARVVPAPNGF